MTTDDVLPLDGGCTCGGVRYRMTSKPMFVHCCHCRWCQRETGASFALNALIKGPPVASLDIGPPLVLGAQMENDEKAIRQLVTTWLDASKAGDTEKVLRLMTDDVVFLIAGQPPMRGKAAFAASQSALKAA